MFSFAWLDNPDQEVAGSVALPTEGASRSISPLQIGSLRLPNNLLLAPMAGVTDGPFRVLCGHLGVGCSISELASANAIMRGNRGTIAMVRYHGQFRPYAVQLFGSDPSLMVAAAQYVESLGICDFIDINMGCPVPKVVKTGAGSALMKTPALAAGIVQTLRAAVRLPVTVKCRLGWAEDDIVVRDFTMRMKDAGAQAITVHARTRSAGYSGAARWHDLDGLGALLDPIPLIANGDISQPEHLALLHERTGCRGFMLGRGALGQPWVFSQLLGHFPVLDAQIKLRIFRRHLQEMLMEYGPKGVPLFRIHAFNYFRNHLRAATLRRSLSEERDPRRILSLAEDFFLNSG